MVKEEDLWYKNIITESIMVYLRLSVHCLKYSRDTRMSLVVKLTIFS